ERLLGASRRRDGARAPRRSEQAPRPAALARARVHDRADLRAAAARTRSARARARGPRPPLPCRAHARRAARGLVGRADREAVRRLRRGGRGQARRAAARSRPGGAREAPRGARRDMTKRPDLLLAVLLGAAATALAGLAAVLVEIGGDGLFGAGAVGVGLV